MKKITRKILYPLYKFLNSPRLRYSAPVEGLRRLFFAHDTREVVMRQVMEWANFRNLKGDYMEFGVFKGDSFIKAYNFAKFAGIFSMKFYAFDSFLGYSKLEGIDKECGYFKESQYICDEASFRKNLLKAGVDLNEVIFIPGFFDKLSENSKNKVKSKTASVVWIDCDLYAPTLQALNFLVDYIADGTIIIFADWYTCNGADNMGQPLAAKEWLSKNPDIKLIEYFNFGSKAFLVSI